LTDFREIKKALCSALVLALPDFNKPFILEDDASDKCIGDVLMHEGRPLSFLSRTLGPKVAGLSTYDKESLALIEALKKWKHYISEATLILRIDQQSLKHIAYQILVQGIQHKLLIKLLGYNYTIEYKKGHENKAADALSRRPRHINLMATSTAIPLWITEVLDSYIEDPKSKELEEQLRVTPSAIPNFTLSNGILIYKGKILIGSTTDLRMRLIESFHSSTLGRHSGERVTYTRLKALFHWPGMKADITHFIKSCPTCQLNKSKNISYPGLLQPLPISDMTFQHLTMDFIDGLPKSEGKDTIPVVIDKLTKYVHFIPLSHPFTTKIVVQLFLDNIFKLHGLPIVIITDRDKIFTSQL
jgi:hypothetical protein